MLLFDFEDVDECSEGTADCHSHASCMNTAGSYQCECTSGYRGNGTDCEGILFKTMMLLLSFYIPDFPVWKRAGSCLVFVCIELDVHGKTLGGCVTNLENLIVTEICNYMQLHFPFRYR